MGGVSRPRPRREVWGSGWGDLQAHTWEVWLGGEVGLQVHTRWGGWMVWLGGWSPGPHPGGVEDQGGIPACTEADTPPTPADGYCCGRYISYWNAFLLEKVINVGIKVYMGKD